MLNYIFPHYYKRKLEYTFALVFNFGLGLWAVINGPLFTFSSTVGNVGNYAGVIGLLHPNIWAFLFIVIGLLHYASLLINGKWWFTPGLRSICIGISVGIFGTFAFGFYLSNPASSAVYIYGIGLTIIGLIMLLTSSSEMAANIHNKFIKKRQ